MKLKVYLETSVFNYYFLKDSKREEEISYTKKLFEQIKEGNFEAYVSEITIRELDACPDFSKREKMLRLISEFNIIGIELDTPYEVLANKYILAEAIPEKKKDDARHIAMATLSEMDILISWNCEHIVKFKTQQIVRTVNLLEGLTNIAINTPKEVVSYE
ncbi:MAG: PIN domain nuclease [Candidatus Firestonebacteria bacterium]